MIAGKFQNLDLNQIGNIVASKNLRHPFQKVWLKVWKACKSAMTIHNLNQLLQSLSITHEGKLFLSYVKHMSIYEILKVWQEKFLKCEFMNSKVWGKKTGHFHRSVAHQISILALKLIKRGPNKMS